MIPLTRAVAAGVLAASALVLAACTATPSPQAQVPTLPASTPGSGSASAPTAGSATSAAADAGRPRERLDMTNAEIAALYTQYNQCLAANGYAKRTSAYQAVLPKAQAACLAKDPLPPWELDANNPHAADFVHAVVLCLRAKGVRYVSEGPPQGGGYVFSFGGPDNDPTSISKGMQYTPACEKQVAAQGIGS